MSVKMVNVSFLLGIAFFLMVTEASPPKTITYTIWSPGENHTTEHTTQEKYLYDIMLEINDANRANFSFAATHYSFGYFIVGMIDVYEISNQIFWMVLGKKDGCDFCFLNLGASSYVPEDGEHIQWRFLTSQQLSDYPWCT